MIHKIGAMDIPTRSRPWLGPAAALTGPAARGDELTIARHLAAIDPSERDAYRAMADQARRLVTTNGSN